MMLFDNALKYSINLCSVDDMSSKSTKKVESGSSKNDPDILPGHLEYNGLLMVTTTISHMDRLSKFITKPTDILIATYPRSGTLFVSEIIWHIKNKAIIISNSCEGLASSRVPMLEMNAYKVKCGLDHVENNSEKPFRLMKTHLPLKMFESIHQVNGSTLFTAYGPKIIVVIRNPKDVAVSLYHFYHNFPEFESWPHHDWDRFFTQFLRGKTMYNDIFQHNIQWWNQRHQSNVLIVHYEDLLRHTRVNIRKIAAFLGESLTQEQEDITFNNVQFNCMYNNPQVNFSFPETNGRLMRKGEIGDWHNHFSPDQSQLMDQVMKKRLMGTNLQYIFE